MDVPNRPLTKTLFKVGVDRQRARRGAPPLKCTLSKIARGWGGIFAIVTLAVALFSMAEVAILLIDNLSLMHLSHGVLSPNHARHDQQRDQGREPRYTPFGCKFSDAWPLGDSEPFRGCLAAASSMATVTVLPADTVTEIGFSPAASCQATSV